MQDEQRTTIHALEPIADDPCAAMTILVSHWEPLAVAKSLGVHNAHVYRFRSDGHVSPTLRRALMKKGFVPTPPKRHRLHYEAGRGDDGAEKRAQLEAEMHAAGCDSFSDYVDLLRAAVDSGGCRVEWLMDRIGDDDGRTD